MSLTAPTMCEICVHRLRQAPTGWTCKAYPNGIPPEIWRVGTIDHRESYVGDQGVRFELDEAVPKDYVKTVLSFYDDLPPELEAG